MVSYGVQGLIEAYYAFDPDKGAKFSTYALPRIRGSILDAIRATHPLPRSLQKFGSDMEKATAALHVEAGPRTDPRRTGGVHGHRAAGLHGVAADEQRARGVAGQPGGDRGQRQRARSCGRWRTTTRTSTRTPWPKRRWCGRGWREAVELLPDREKTIVRLYYMKSQSLKSIGDALGISESRASQLRHRAIRRLRMVLTQELQDAA